MLGRNKMCLQGRTSTTGKAGVLRTPTVIHVCRGYRNLKAIILHLNEKVGLLDTTD